MNPYDDPQVSALIDVLALAVVEQREAEDAGNMHVAFELDLKCDRILTAIDARLMESDTVAKAAHAAADASRNDPWVKIMIERGWM